MRSIIFKFCMARQSILLFCLLLPFVPILLISALSSLPIFFIGFPLILLNVLLYILYGIIKTFIKRAYIDKSHPSGDILLPSPVLKAADPITIMKLPSSRGVEPPDMDREESSEPMPPRYRFIVLF